MAHLIWEDYGDDYHPRIGCFIYNDSTFWSMLAHGVTTRAAEFGATVEVLSARDADGQHVDALVVGVIDPERGARSARAAAKASIPVIAVVAELPDSVARSTIRVDDTGGAQLGAEHLASMISGHGAVAHLQGALDVRTAVNRAQGFRMRTFSTLRDGLVFAQSIDTHGHAPQRQH